MLGGFIEIYENVSDNVHDTVMIVNLRCTNLILKNVDWKLKW